MWLRLCLWMVHSWSHIQPPLTRWQSQSCLPARIASHRVWFECCDIEIYRPPASCFGFGFGLGLGLGLGLLLAVRWCAFQVVHRYVYNAPLIRSFRVCALNNSKTEHKKKHRNTSKHTEKYLIKIYVQPQKQSQRAIPPPQPPTLHLTESPGKWRLQSRERFRRWHPSATSLNLRRPAESAGVEHLKLCFLPLCLNTCRKSLEKCIAKAGKTA